MTMPEDAVTVFLREVVQRLDDELLKWNPPGGVRGESPYPAPRWLAHAWSGRWQLVFAQRELAKLHGEAGESDAKAAG